VQERGDRVESSHYLLYFISEAVAYYAAQQPFWSALQAVRILLAGRVLVREAEGRGDGDGAGGGQACE
jgi:hypothetical protein